MLLFPFPSKVALSKTIKPTRLTMSELLPATFSDTTHGVFTLPPQTTPFAPKAPGASGSCTSRSILCFTSAGHLAKGYACDLVDSVDVNSCQYLDKECYPPHYDLINHGGT